ncbi:SUF system Fe-S cluster assembly protein [Maricaulis sp.]|uniref:SUF system Fe-S cluster assembly protein n=1 Tax=Maricaulis sp. TaxID=1486257 RepID=UPI0025FB8CA2|nr:SUF system Fe-S cluster assembly protein [Maricaulis sp.]MDF1767322.1 SUF system Fe-S cluster assembly protein [Maricaulis sp.]
MTEQINRDVIDLSAPAEPVAASAIATESRPADGTGAIPADELARITDAVVEALKSVYDPEIPVDIYELGLIYKVDLEDDRTLKVQMSLTAPGCPVAGEMPGWVQEAVEKVEGVDRALVDLTFEPPWTPDRMSDEARLALNMF